MKKINLNGISEILSEKEMKNTVGGGERQVVIKEAPDPCDNLAAGNECKIFWSGGESIGHCYYPAGSGHLTCSA